MAKLATLALAGSLLAACADPGPKPPAYGWGGYEDLIYDMYAKPGEATPEVQIEQLSAGIEEAESAGLQAGPGVYAHLGYMQYLTGNVGAARDALERERSLYPESTTFIDGLLKQLEQG
ncbi:MAG: DUF4810 domain-containing protein [Alphaproteobacteria bacterium]|nr:DUF4810 domain-containing protein [Alphaproteobacteria bacterium]